MAHGAGYAYWKGIWGTEAEAASRYKVWVFCKWNVDIGSWAVGDYKWGTQPSPTPEAWLLRKGGRKAHLPPPT